MHIIGSRRIFLIYLDAICVVIVGSTFCAGDLDYYNLLEEQEFGIDQTTNVTKYVQYKHVSLTSFKLTNPFK